MQQKIKRVHDFWFGSDCTTAAWVKARLQQWFSSSKAWDREIKRLFNNDLTCAAAGEYTEWAHTPDGALALILILDQFSRNIHRGTPRAFACDELALTACRRMIESKQDRALPFIKRLFAAMPLQHAENVAVQQRSKAWFTEWAAAAPLGFKHIAASNLRYAELHCEIIHRFGRFPHRNAILGRESTADERAYLESSDTDFGQSIK